MTTHGRASGRKVGTLTSPDGSCSAELSDGLLQLPNTRLRRGELALEDSRLHRVLRNLSNGTHHCLEAGAKPVIGARVSVVA